MDWILLLALATFVLVMAFLIWNRVSTKRHQESGGTATGIGGRADPISGDSEGMRNPDEMRADLDAAAAEQPRAGVPVAAPAQRKRAGGDWG